MMSEEKKGLSFVLAVLMHSLIVAFLFFGVQWQTKAPPPVEAELWQAGALEPEAPAPIAKPVVRAAKPKPVVHEPEPVEETPPPKVKPEIAIEKPRPQPKPVEKKKPEPPKPEPKKPEPKPEPVKKPEPEKKVEKKVEPKPEKKPESTFLNALGKKYSEQEGKLKTAPVNPTADLKSFAERNQAAEAGKKGDALKGYADLVRNKIRSKMTYPGEDSENLAVVISVKLLPDMTIFDAEVLKPSGNTAFDNAALRAVKELQQYPPLPKGIDFEQVRKNTFTYKLKM